MLCVILILVVDYLGLHKTHDGDVFLPLKKPPVAARMNSRWAMYFHLHISSACTNSSCCFPPWSCESSGCWDLLSIFQCQEAFPLPLRAVDQFGVFFRQCFSLRLACKALALSCALNILHPPIGPLPETLLGSFLGRARVEIQPASITHRDQPQVFVKLKVKDLRCRSQMSLGWFV